MGRAAPSAAITLDFKGGVKVQVAASTSSGLGGVTLQIIGFEMAAQSPVLGWVTLSQSDIDSACVRAYRLPIRPFQVVKKDPVGHVLGINALLVQ